MKVRSQSIVGETAGSGLLPGDEHLLAAGVADEPATVDVASTRIWFREPGSRNAMAPQPAVSPGGHFPGRRMPSRLPASGARIATPVRKDCTGPISSFSKAMKLARS